MKLWFLRHALAEEAGSFPGPDLQRPLTAEGRRQAVRMFRHLAEVRQGPQAVFASEAVRAWETADLFCVSYRMERAVRTPLLNPGCSLKKLKTLVKDEARGLHHIGLVGHEPDLSTLISRLTGKGELAVKLKKCALAEVELDKGWDGTLTLLMPPDLVAA